MNITNRAFKYVEEIFNVFKHDIDVSEIKIDKKTQEVEIIY